MFLITSCEVQDVKIGKLESFNIVNITKDFITIDIAVPVDNPNNFGFAIQKAKLDITMNKVALGSIDKIKKVRIAKNSNDIHHFVFRLPFNKMMNGGLLSIPALLTGRAHIKITGFVKASTWLLFTKKIEVNYDKRIRIGKNR